MCVCVPTDIESLFGTVMVWHAFGLAHPSTNTHTLLRKQTMFALDQQTEATDWQE